MKQCRRVGAGVAFPGIFEPDSEPAEIRTSRTNVRNLPVLFTLEIINFFVLNIVLYLIHSQYTARDQGADILIYIYDILL